MFFITSSLNVNAQVVKDTGDISSEISTVIIGMPGASGNEYTIPSTAQLSSWGSMLNNLLNTNYADAADTANNLNYALIQFLDTSENPHTTYYVLKGTGVNYWGTYVFNPNYCRPLVIQAPHPRFDINTGNQAIHVF